jgi:V/A-type H+/Na+-transporting ATPase subunit B
VALARGRDLRRLVSIIGEAALSERDRSYLVFAHDFEHEFVNRGSRRRNIEETLYFAWQLLRGLPSADPKRLDPRLLARYGGSRSTVGCPVVVVLGAAVGAH